MIEIPDINKCKGIVLVKNTWYVRYWEDGKERRASLLVSSESGARVARDIFYKELVDNRKATIRRRRKPVEKLKDKPDLYVYYRLPYYVSINGKIVGEAQTRKQAREIRDNYLKGGSDE